MLSKQTILNHLKKVDPILHKYALEIEIIEGTEPPDLYVHLTDAIVSQQLSTKAGTTIFNRFKALFPNEKITPEEVVKLDTETIRSAGLSYAKVAYIKDLAQKVISKEVELEKFHEMSDEDIIKELTLVKGIGPWTAEMFLMFALKRDDVFSSGDLGLRNAIQKIYNLQEKPTKEQLIEISSKWTPYRTFASRILWKTLEI